MESIATAYVAWRAGTSNAVVVPAHQAWNRFLGSFEGLQIRVQVEINQMMEEEYAVQKATFFCCRLNQLHPSNPPTAMFRILTSLS
jgi:hypothetical protein